LNKNVGEWDWDALANYFDVGELTDWGFTENDLQYFDGIVIPESGTMEEPEFNPNVIITLEMTNDKYYEIKDKIEELTEDGITINIS